MKINQSSLIENKYTFKNFYKKPKSFLISMNNKIFKGLYDDQLLEPISDLISTKINSNFKEININIFFQNKHKLKTNSTPICGYWDQNKWKFSGCYLNDIIENKIYWCKCNHTTFFALLSVIINYKYKKKKD